MCVCVCVCVCDWRQGMSIGRELSASECIASIIRIDGIEQSLPSIFTLYDKTGHSQMYCKNMVHLKR